MIGKIRNLITMFAVLAVGLIFAACSTTQSPKRQIDDSAINAAVKARLTAARFSNLTNISVNVTNGVVTLSGEVPDARTKKDAEDEVKKVDGVVAVNDNLQVKQPSAANKEKVEDRVATQVRQ